MIVVVLQVLQSSENVSDQMHNSRVARKVLPNATVSSSKAKKQEPPKPPRSAFMCFTDTKKKEIMSHHGIVQVWKSSPTCPTFEILLTSSL
jgi:hypothetical protein